MARVTSPVEGFNGPGPGGVEFVDGVAETDNDMVIAYFRRAGYGIDGDEATQPETPAPAVDSRDVAGETKVGAPLRDAAVDPQPGDFLAPVNAGQEDPHGPRVVAPGLHAMPPGPVVPGDVHVDDVRAQEDIETAVAEAVLVHQGDVGEVTQAAAKANGVTTAEDPDGTDASPSTPQRPAKSASKAEWVAYAERVDSTEGVPLGHVDPESLSKAELIERYGDR